MTFLIYVYFLSIYNFCDIYTVSSYLQFQVDIIRSGVQRKYRTMHRLKGTQRMLLPPHTRKQAFICPIQSPNGGGGQWTKLVQRFCFTAHKVLHCRIAPTTTKVGAMSHQEIRMPRPLVLAFFYFYFFHSICNIIDLLGIIV